MSVTAFLTTVSGSATSFLPLTTAWPSAGANCASAVYEQADGHFLGWDPWYAANLDSDLTTCWPPEATSWWNQDADSSVTTVLGTSFACPSAYSAVATSTVANDDDSDAARTLCCPSSYTLHQAQWDKPNFPSQCASVLAAGETLAWDRIAGDDVNSWTATSSTIQSGGIVTVWGLPINGMNLVAARSTATATSSGSSPTTTASAGATGASAATATTTSSSSSDKSNSSSSLVAVAVGASVGAVAGVLVLVGLAWFLWRRVRRNREAAAGGEGGGPGGSVDPLMMKYIWSVGPNSSELDGFSDAGASAVASRQQQQKAFLGVRELPADHGPGGAANPAELSTTQLEVYELAAAVESPDRHRRDMV